MAYDKKKQTLYCTIDNVKIPVVYNNSRNYSNPDDGFCDIVTVTPELRLAQQLSLKQTNKPINSFTEVETTVVQATPQQEQTTTTTPKKISPVFIFDYSSGIRAKNFQVDIWATQTSDLSLRQNTAANKPFLGKNRNGVVGSSVPFFFNENQSFLSTTSSVTLSGDFTLFAYIQPVIIQKINKYVRILGNSGDANMFLVIREGNNESKLSFSASSSADVNLSTNPYPSSPRFLVTIQREGNTLIYRENKTTLAVVDCPTTDFVFDQVGRVGTDINTYNGGIYHLSAFDGVVKDRLELIEDAIIRTSEAIKA